MLRIGLLSDTHGLLRPQVLDVLRGCDHLVHAGDIGDPSILQVLATLAPLTAVRGNNDHGPWAEPLPEHVVLDIGGVRLQVLHDRAHLPRHACAGAQVVITGHSHQPRIAHVGDVLHVNPGSCGPRRFRLPITVAELLLDGAQVTAHLRELA